MKQVENGAGVQVGKTNDLIREECLTRSYSSITTKPTPRVLN